MYSRVNAVPLCGINMESWSSMNDKKVTDLTVAGTNYTHVYQAQVTCT